MTKKPKKKEADSNELSDKHEAFIREYLKDHNATRAYMRVYTDSSYEAARSSSSELLTKSNIKARIDELRQDLEKLAGISKFKVLNEFMAIGFSSMANLHKDWFTQKEFDELSAEEKACIAEVKKEIIKGDTWEKEVLKIKLYDKQRALENIAKLLGYNEQTDDPKELNININVINPNK